MPTGDDYSSKHLAASHGTWVLQRFYLLSPILLPKLSLFFFRTMHFEHPSVLSRVCLYKRNSLKICYDKAGNLPKKGRNFNTQTWGKIVYFLFVWLVGIGFRQNFFRVLPNFGDLGAKMSFFHYIINQNRNNFIKHCSPPRVPRSCWYQRCVSI